MNGCESHLRVDTIMGIRILVACLLGFVASTSVHAVVYRVEVRERVSVLNGREFGASGAYEKLSGDIVFAIDPANEHNQRIVDLTSAPRLANGLCWRARTLWFCARWMRTRATASR